MASPQLATAHYGGGATPPSSIPFNRPTGHLNDSLHRHSFNESIYSEPYSGRYAQPTYSRTNPLCESTSASNLIGRPTGQRPRPMIPFVAQIHASEQQRNVYGTQSSIASQYTTTEAGSTRSSIYSDKTILNDITPPATPPRTIATYPKTASASNASGSQSAQAPKPINQCEIEAKAIAPAATTKTTTTTTAIIETAPTSPPHVDKVTVSAHCQRPAEGAEANGSAAPVMRRPKNKDNNSNSNSAVRRVSYLRATANDIAEQGAEPPTELSANVSAPDNSQSDRGNECDRNEDLQLFMEYLR